jgi:predicted phage terminase large subunit-like protein
MSATPSSTPRDTLERLVREDPLAHPLPAAISLFDFSLAPPPHLREIYGAVYRALSDDYPEAPRHLSRLMPREHGKTEAGTVVIPTWAALDDPNIRILLMSINEDKAADKLSEIAEHIERLAPQFGRRIVTNNQTQLQLEREDTYEEPTIQAAGFKTGVTGGHYDLLIFDDVVEYDTQRTTHRREHAWKKFQDFLNLDSKQGNSTFLVLGTRKHREDLYHQLIHSIGWDVRVEQAIADDHWHVIENGAYELKTRHQETGAEQWYDAGKTSQIDAEHETVVAVDVETDVDVLWPEWAPIESLIKDMVVGYGAEEGTLVWQRENQNDPGAMEGQVLSEDMLSFVDALPNRALRLYAGVDLGVEDDPEKAARNDTDYWAVATVAEDPTAETAYLVDLQRERGMTLQEGVTWLSNSLADVEHEFGQAVNQVLVESNQAQRWFPQTAQDAGLHVEETTSSGDKEQRIIDMSSRFEQGKVRLLEGAMADWQQFIAREWSGFPTARHDDRLDAIEIALRNLHTGSEWSRSDHDLGDVF